MDNACTDGDSEELDEEQTSRFRPSVLEPREGTRTLNRKVVEAIVETFKALTVTERRVRRDESESQQGVKKPEEQTSAVTQTAQFQEAASTTADSLRGEVNVCDDGRAERNCEVRKRHYQEGDGVQECEHRQQFEGVIRKDFGSEGTRRVSLARMTCVQNTEEQRVVVTIPQN